MGMKTEDLKISVEDKVATFTFNRPDKFNALSGKLIQSAKDHLQEFAVDPAVGVIVLTGAGRAFCAGGDVSSMAGQDGVTLTYEESIDSQRSDHEMPWLLHNIPKVTIAAVNGYAMGAGLGISLCCDLRLASEKAKFGTAFARVGFGGDYGTTWKLTRLVGEAKAKEMFFLGDIVDAQEALRIGLANQVFSEEEFAAKVQEAAAQIAHGPQVSYRYMKENINLSANSDFKTILDREALTHLRCGQTEDHKEGVAAFIEKRQPNFKGR